MIIVGFNVPKILKSIKGEDTVDKLLIVDESNVFEGALESLKKLDTGYEIEIANLKYDEVKEKIQSEEIESAIFVEKQEENIKIKYIVKDATNDGRSTRRHNFYNKYFIYQYTNKQIRINRGAIKINNTKF
ncbi:MAG: hypothetical protein V8R26_00765 [Clostridia bacterium]